jgi:hypothetical protein
MKQEVIARLEAEATTLGIALPGLSPIPLAAGT